MLCDTLPSELSCTLLPEPRRTVTFFCWGNIPLTPDYPPPPTPTGAESYYTCFGETFPHSRAVTLPPKQSCYAYSDCVVCLGCRLLGYLSILAAMLTGMAGTVCRGAVEEGRELQRTFSAQTINISTQTRGRFCHSLELHRGKT